MVLTLPTIMAGGSDSNGDQGRRTFGLRVRTLRQAAGLSQESLAERAGLHRTYVSSLERGQRNVGLDNILKLAAALEVPPRRLFEAES
jgi:transcriptional regulator with XRE-family HTH domain